MEGNDEITPPTENQNNNQILEETKSFEPAHQDTHLTEKSTH